MTETAYDLIAEEFNEDLSALVDIVKHTQTATLSSKSKVSAVNSSVLLLAARFEEFVRQMARQSAKDIVINAPSINDVPRKLSATAWKRTLENVARAKIDTGGKPISLKDIHSSSLIRIKSILDFLNGDQTQDIYHDLMHNENNMRPDQINGLFSICEIKDICMQLSSQSQILSAFKQTDPGKAHGALIEFINDFMETRNDIAHALGALKSIGPDTFESYAYVFTMFSKSLANFLNSHFSKSSLTTTKLLPAPTV